MMYIFAFWTIFLLFFLVYGISKLLKKRELESSIKENAALVFIVLGVIVYMAIITKDPITILGLNIPAEMQWLGSLFVFAFGSWQFYFRPLKSKMYQMDRELGELKVSVRDVEARVERIEEKISNIEAGMINMTKDILEIKHCLTYKQS